MGTECCINCKFWWESPRAKETGFCRRHAPSLVANASLGVTVDRYSTTRTLVRAAALEANIPPEVFNVPPQDCLAVWPETKGNDWCGEWEALGTQA